MRTFSAAWAWTGTELLRRPTVTVGEDGRIGMVSVGYDHATSGILLPGFINAHAHVELSGLHRRVPGDGDMLAWVERLIAARSVPDSQAMKAALQEISSTGTAAVLDVSNTGAPLPFFAESASTGRGRLQGTLQYELLAIAESSFDEGLLRFASLPESYGVTRILTPHSVHAVGESSLRRWAALPRPTGPTPTLHCDECPADQELIREGTGPWTDLLDRWGRPWQGALAPGRSEVEALHRLGLLGPGLGLVHLLAADAEDLDLVASTGAPAVLCPRSNLHIHGRLPDTPGMVRRGIPLALGTDSLASNADLDLLAEASTLSLAFPEVDPAVWLSALTRGGARLFGDPGLGSLHEGARPGLLLVHIPPTDDPITTLLSGERWPRSWLV